MSFREIEIKNIQPNQLNPRLDLNIEALNELAESINQVGLVEPIIVRPVDDGYEVVVGERRYRASQQAGLEKILAIVRDYSDDEVIELNLVENIHREDLSAVEKGNCCKHLMEKYAKKYPTQKALATKIGVSPSVIGRWLQLVEAPLELQKMVDPVERPRPRPIGTIDYDTALTITRQIDEPERQIQVAREIAQRPVRGRLARRVIQEIAKEPEKPVEDIVKEIVEEPYEMPFRLYHKDPILKGIKMQTTRRGIPDPRVKEGAVIHAAVWEPHFAKLYITGIDRKRLRDFTENDARREGGYTLEEFKKTWIDLHGEWNSDEQVYLIHFGRADED
jgi:ParB/RepB/Spo0J family partition protein